MSGYLQFLLLGLGSGAALALLGLGLVLEFRSSGVINFAHGAIAMFVAFAYVELQQSGQLILPVVLLPHEITLHNGPINPWLAAAISLVYAGVLGAAIYFLIFKHLEQRPALTKLVASVALMLYIQYMVVLNLGTAAFGAGIPSGVSLLPTNTVKLFGLNIPANRLWLGGVAVVIAAALSVVYRRTRFGLATRAAAETEEGVVVLGYSATTLGVSNWIIATVLAGLAGILIAPITGLNQAIFILLVVPALGAALVGKLRSFGITLIAALAIGMLQSELVKLVADHSWLPQQGLTDGLPFVVIIVTLFIFGDKLPLRGSLREPRPPPSSRPRRVPLYLCVGVAVTLVALYTLPGTLRLGVIQSELMIPLLLSVVLLTGYCGQISLTQMAFAGAGGFFVSISAQSWGVPFPLTLLLGSAVAVVFGFVIALPALRSRGLHLAVLTLAAGVAFDDFFFGNSSIAGGIAGRLIPSPKLFGLDLGMRSSNTSDYPRPIFGVLVLVVVVAAVWIVANLRLSATGRQMLAVRARENAASASGVGIAGTKLFAFALSAFIAGIAGGLIGYQYSAVSQDQFGIFVSLSIVVLACVGGVGGISGAVFAAIVFAPSGIWFTIMGTEILPAIQNYAPIIGALALIIRTVALPDGIAVAWSRRFDRLGSRMQRRKGRTSGDAVPGPADLLVDQRNRTSTREIPISLVADLAPKTTAAPATAAVPGPAKPGRPTRHIGDRLLKVNNLSVTFGGLVAVHDLSLVVHAGQLVGLIGPNGAGKTTTMDAITGFNNPRSGDIEFAGVSMNGMNPDRRNRIGMGRTFQALELFEDITVEENLLVAAERRTLGGRFLDLVAPKRKGPGTQAAEDALERLDLTSIRQCLAGELSTAQRKRVAIGRALASRPRLLLLDEPAAGLDATEGEHLGELLGQLVSDDTAILVIDHDMGLMFNVCDYIYVLDFGQLIAEGTPQEIQANPVVIEAYLGSPVAAGGVPVTTARARALQAPATPEGES